MKNYVLIILFMLVSTISYTQDLTWSSPIYETKEIKYKLHSINANGDYIIKVTKHKEGAIQQRGYYVNNRNHGIWKLYTNGKLKSIMKYNYGKKVWLKSFKKDQSIYVKYLDGKPINVTYQLALN